MLTLALTSKTHPYKAGFEPFPGDVYRIPYAYCYRCSYSLEVSLVRSLLRAPSRRHFQARGRRRRRRRGDRRAGAGRRRIRRSARRILSECSSTSAASTAFSSSPTKCRPDSPAPAQCLPASTTASSPTSGHARSRWAEACRSPPSPAAPKSWTRPVPADLGGTFAGNPLSCAAALAVLESSRRENLLARANELGDRFQKRAAQWQKRWPHHRRCARPGRNAGASNWCGRATPANPPPKRPSKITQYCYEHGLITITAGRIQRDPRAGAAGHHRRADGRSARRAGIRAAVVYEKKGAVAQLV